MEDISILCRDVSGAFGDKLYRPPSFDCPGQLVCRNLVGELGISCRVEKPVLIEPVTAFIVCTFGDGNRDADVTDIITQCGGYGRRSSTVFAGDVCITDVSVHRGKNGLDLSKPS